MVANLLACAGLCLSVAASTDLPPDNDGRQMLSCEGTLTNVGQSAGPIVANGFIDLKGGWVYGFGIGGVPIVRVTRTEVSFASATVSGSLDRRTGHTRIEVSAGEVKPKTLMAMELSCRFSPPMT
jgi:hypothetical protein